MKDLHNTWAHRWITPKARSAQSKIDRLGVVAIQDIKKGEPVGVLGGVIVSSREIEKYWYKMGHVGIQIDDNFFIVPTSREELEITGVFNHSCDPNCGFSNSITFITLRDIKAGEELVFDYAFCESKIKEFVCECGSLNCRKVIKPTDWKNSELWEKYGEYYSPYLREKF
jgi:uncharacterized protein